MIPAGLSRETRIRRDARGRWFDGDEPIAHPGIERAFDRWIDRAEDGRYILKNSVNWAYVSLEGPPLFVRQVVIDELGAMLVVSDQQTVRLDPSTLRQGADGQIYCTIRGFAAAFERAAAMQLGDAASGDEALSLGGATYAVPLAEDPLR